MTETGDRKTSETQVVKAWRLSVGMMGEPRRTGPLAQGVDLMSGRGGTWLIEFIRGDMTMTFIF